MLFRSDLGVRETRSRSFSDDLLFNQGRFGITQVAWADYVLTWEGLRRLANDLLGRKPYDGRNPLAEPVLRDLLTLSLNNEGYVVLPQNWTDDGNRRYGPLCPRCEARHKYEARKVGTVPDPAWLGAHCVDCCRTVDGATHEVTIYAW